MNQLEISFPILAGFFSTALFALGTLPMLVKAFRTKNMASYSLGNILISNVGNLIHSIYVFHLPPGPIWFLHSFYLLSTGLMLVWYLRYEGLPQGLRSAAHHTVRKQLKNIDRRLHPVSYLGDTTGPGFCCNGSICKPAFCWIITYLHKEKRQCSNGMKAYSIV